MLPHNNAPLHPDGSYQMKKLFLLLRDSSSEMHAGVHDSVFRLKQRGNDSKCADSAALP